MRLFIIIGCMLHASSAAPQFITFKDGKIGVNFGGYHAEAGLGGLLTGDAAHGGLGASAGTPWGQEAAAGLNGAVNGRAAGVAYAGAQANPSVGASAVLGGSAGEHGFAGSEAHTYGKFASNSISRGVVQSTQQQQPQQTPVANAQVATAIHEENVIQRIKPPKKYALVQNEQNLNAKNENRNIATVPTTITTKTNNDNLPQASDINVARTSKASNKATASVRIAARSTDIGGLNSTSENEAPVKLTRQQQRQLERERKLKKYLKWPRQRTQDHQSHRRKVETTVAADEEVKNIVARDEPVEEPQSINQTPTQPETNVVRTKEVIKTVQIPVQTVTNPVQTTATTSTTFKFNSDIIGSVLNIPIGILRSLQDTLSSLHAAKTVTFRKHAFF